MKTRPVAEELLQAKMQTDGRTDITMQIVCFALKIFNMQMT
jgi:hypothetical protein